MGSLKLILLEEDVKKTCSNNWSNFPFSPFRFGILLPHEPVDSLATQSRPRFHLVNFVSPVSSDRELSDSRVEVLISAWNALKAKEARSGRRRGYLCGGCNSFADAD